MTKQTSLFPTAEELRDIGIQTALDNADLHNANWTDLAYEFLLNYMQTHNEFMTEDVRVEAEKSLPLPPSKRAWGGIVVRAVKCGLIKRIGFKNVKNKAAHCTPASLWGVVK